MADGEISNRFQSGSGRQRSDQRDQLRNVLWKHRGLHRNRTGGLSDHESTDQGSAGSAHQEVPAMHRNHCLGSNQVQVLHGGYRCYFGDVICTSATRFCQSGSSYTRSLVLSALLISLDSYAPREGTLNENVPMASSSDLAVRAQRFTLAVRSPISAPE